MRNIGWIQWIIRVIKRDMEQYEEDVGVKQEVYRTVKRKSYIFVCGCSFDFECHVADV